MSIELKVKIAIFVSFPSYKYLEDICAILEFSSNLLWCDVNVTPDQCIIKTLLKTLGFKNCNELANV